jgi:hypothetical protein
LTATELISVRAEVHPGVCAGDGEPWFYFCARQDREARGGRPSRTTPSGYWKAAGTPGLVYSADGRPVGTKKTMVFYGGRAPAGAKTNWKMNEYRAFDDDDADAAAPNPFLQVHRSTLADDTLPHKNSNSKKQSLPFYVCAFMR